MGKKTRTKKQIKFYRHLARQTRKAKTHSNDVRRVVLKNVEEPKRTVVIPPNVEVINSDDAISITASDNDFN